MELKPICLDCFSMPYVTMLRLENLVYFSSIIIIKLCFYMQLELLDASFAVYMLLLEGLFVIMSYKPWM